MESGRFEFVILGAGAIGSIIAAHLARCGRSVAVVARGERALQIQQVGLRICGLATFVQPVRVITDVAGCRGAEVLIVATKALNTPGAIEPLRSLPIEAALSIQNGMMKNVHLAEAFGSERVLGAIANTSGELRPGGEVLFTRNELIAIGERGGGVSERARRIAAALDEAGVHTQPVGDINSLEWAKFASWAGLMLLSITTRKTSDRFLADSAGARLIVRVVREIGVLAVNCGAALSDRSALPVARICSDSEEEAVALIQSIGREMEVRSPEHRMSSLQDLEARRPLEIEETLGYALRLAAERRTSLPLVAAFHPLAVAIDRINRDSAPHVA